MAPGEDLFVIYVACLLVLKGVPGEGFYVPGVVCPLVLREGYQGKTCLHICSLSPGAPRRTPGEDLSVLV